MRPWAAAISLRLNEIVVTRNVPPTTMRMDGTSRKAAAWPLTIMAPELMTKAPPTPSSVAQSKGVPLRAAGLYKGDRQSVDEGKRVSVSVRLGGRGMIHKIHNTERKQKRNRII